MIKTGIDLVEVERIRNLAKKRGGLFLRRVFSEEEIRYSFRHRDPWPHLAARFAAKEALVKSLGKDFTFREISVEHEASGRPVIRLLGGSKRIAEKAGLKSLEVSLTHTKSLAVAMVMAETGKKPKDKVVGRTAGRGRTA